MHIARPDRRAIRASSARHGTSCAAFKGAHDNDFSQR